LTCHLGQKTLFKQLIFILMLLSYQSYSSDMTSSLSPSDETCRTVDIGFKWEKRKRAAFATSLAQQPNSLVQSNCLLFTGISPFITLTNESNIEVSIDGGDYRPMPAIIFSGNTVRLRKAARNLFGDNKIYSIYILGDGKNNHNMQTGRIEWTIQTHGVYREKKIWNVGPNEPAKQLKDITNLLAPGDEIHLMGDAIYDPIDIRGISGTRALPITLKGISKNGKRPTLRGGTERFNWTLALRNSHFWHIDNIILERGGICYRHESAYIKLSKVLIRHCGNGILGTDYNSGSLHISQLELTRSGGKPEKKNWRHGIYMATDRDRFPESIFTIEKSFLHNNKGNSIKSRAERTEVYGNWLENTTNQQSIYALELIGYDGYETLEPINHDVVGNVIAINSIKYGVRVGGDGTGSSNGPSRFSENIFLMPKDFKGYIFRLLGHLQFLDITNNMFLSQNQGSKSITLIKDYIPSAQWFYQMPHIRVSGNTFTSNINFYHSEESGKVTNYEGIYKYIDVNNNETLQLDFLTNGSIHNIIFEKLSLKKAYINTKVTHPKFFKKLYNPKLNQRPHAGGIPFQ
jgi:hypothetical protein